MQVSTWPIPLDGSSCIAGGGLQAINLRKICISSDLEACDIVFPFAQPIRVLDSICTQGSTAQPLGLVWTMTNNAADDVSVVLVSPYSCPRTVVPVLGVLAPSFHVP